MRIVPTLLTLSALTGAALVGAAAPASALHQCESIVKDICLVTDAITIPVGTPVIAPTGPGEPNAVPGPRICNTTTGQCTGTYVLLPAASVSSSGQTVTSITLPSYGFDLEDGVPTLYVGVPSLGPGSSTLGVTLVAHVPYVPAGTDDSDTTCAKIADRQVGPVRVWSAYACTLSLAITL